MTSADAKSRLQLAFSSGVRRYWQIVALQFALLVAGMCPGVSAGAQARDPIIMEVAAAEVCLSVEMLKPVQPASRFHANAGRLYCLSRIGGIEKPTRIQHIWYFGGEQRLRITLPVSPPSWRTFSCKAISAEDIGSWRVEISDAAGNVMKTVRFEITAPPP